MAVLYIYSSLFLLQAIKEIPTKQIQTCLENLEETLQKKMYNKKNQCPCVVFMPLEMYFKSGKEGHLLLKYFQQAK